MAVRRITLTSTAAGAVTTALTKVGRMVRVKNVDNAGYVSFTVDGSTPTLRGDETYALAKNDTEGFEVPIPHAPAAPTVKHIGSVDTVIQIEVV